MGIVAKTKCLRVLSGGHVGQEERWRERWRSPVAFFWHSLIDVTLGNVHPLLLYFPSALDVLSFSFSLLFRIPLQFAAMTDNVCHSILKTATQQIIQSAGFEAANNHSIDTLTDIFGQYIELLGSTVSAYAHLNGRTLGTPRDLVEALDDVSLDAKTLKSWLEDEGKALSPCWSAQSDPGRLLQGKHTYTRNGRAPVDKRLISV